MTDEKHLQEMQILEQNLQNLLFQKQAFQMELTETQSAIMEIENSGDDVFKIIGQMMIKTEKSKMQEELKNKEKILELRLKTIERQESSFTGQLEKIRDNFIQEMKR